MPSQFNDLDYWKAIVLFGLNTATYKIALGEVLLDLAQHGTSTVYWDALSEAFLDKYVERLSRENTMPQQAHAGRLTVMERVVKKLTAVPHSRDEAISIVGQEGFNNVIPRFQTIGRHRDLVGDRFYEIEFGKRLILKDSLHVVATHNIAALQDELETRWNLLEGAFLIKNDAWNLSNDLRMTFIAGGSRRRDLTGNIPFLNAYQCNICFYCGQEINYEDIHVDHVLPRQVVQHDEIWNLVLAHSFCNLHKSDHLVADHFIEKLSFRNENIMGSSHPWKKKIALTLGDTATQRRTRLRKEYNTVAGILGKYYWGGSSSYNPATDPFFKRLITVISNNM
jgi:5-methylcytosine-specific restriction endonuclease McrA